MLEWFEGLAGPEFATAVLWTFAALLLLVIVLVIIRLIRSLTFGTFVAGGRNRKTRLAVMDATAVDSHRRLVLVRRDDIEHLLLIGGPTDVVVEREIRLGQPRRPAFIGENGLDAPAPARPPCARARASPPARAPARSPCVRPSACSSPLCASRSVPRSLQRANLQGRGRRQSRSRGLPRGSRPRRRGPRRQDCRRQAFP